MEIGTADLVELPEDKEKKPGSRSRLSSGGSSGKGGGNNGGGGGGSDRNPDPDQADVQQYKPEKSKFVTGFLLVVVFMTFAGVIAAYIVIATNGVAEWRPFSLPIPVWVSTILILISSFTYHVAKTSLDVNDQPKAKKWLIVTTVLGAAFISSQLLAWLELVKRGMYMYSNPYAGFFYILTGLHALHVLGGIIALGSIILRAWVPTQSEEEMLRRRTLGSVVGWYWHFLGGLWFVLFILLGFWK